MFTVPSDPALPNTIERARVVAGKVVHELPAVYHGDSVRGDGILAFRDFGADTAERVSRPSFSCHASTLRMPDGPSTTVYVAQKGS